VDPSEIEQPLQQLAIEAGAGATTRPCAHGAHGHAPHAHANGGPCPDAGPRGADQGVANGGLPAANGGAHACGGHGHGHGHSHAAGAHGISGGSEGGSIGRVVAAGVYGPDGIAAPLASEVAAATSEAARGLDAAIEEINSALEEVRDAVAELQG
jgi:hypothetical protein